MNSKQDKISELIRLLPDHIDAALITSKHNRRYFTGFHSSAGILIVTRRRCIFMTDFRYIEDARRSINCADCVEYSSVEGALREFIRDENIKMIAAEDDNMSCSERKRFSMMLKGVEICGGILDPLINELRLVKTAGELDMIRMSQELTDYGFQKILEHIHAGITEREIAIELEFIMRRQGAECAAFDFIVVSGSNSSLPHGTPSEKPLENGDFVIIDFGAVVDGWHSDMTRTLAVGTITEDQHHVYNTVLCAQQAALDTLADHVSCSRADAAARNVIAAAGFGDFFGHGTGHGVGMEIHEQPRLSPAAGDALLKCGSVVTVEPGIYLPGKFGVRIEDMAHITSSGYENLTKSTKELIIV